MQILQLESAPQLQQGLQALAAQYTALGEAVQQQLGAVQAGLASGFGGISTQLPQGPSWQAIAATLQSQGELSRPGSWACVLPPLQLRAEALRCAMLAESRQHHMQHHATAKDICSMAQ